MAGVTPNGIHYPDGASKAKNLGPELEQMALDIDWYIGSYLRPDGPIRQIVIDIAEEVVPPMVASELERQIEELGLIKRGDYEVYIRKNIQGWQVVYYAEVGDEAYPIFGIKDSGTVWFREDASSVRATFPVSYADVPDSIHEWWNGAPAVKIGKETHGCGVTSTGEIVVWKRRDRNTTVTVDVIGHIAAGTPADDHNAPSYLAEPGRRHLVVWQDHGNTTQHHVAVGDTEGETWLPQVDLDQPGPVSYQQVFFIEHLSTSTTSTYWIFYRSSVTAWAIRDFTVDETTGTVGQPTMTGRVMSALAADLQVYCIARPVEVGGDQGMDLMVYPNPRETVHNVKALRVNFVTGEVRDLINNTSIGNITDNDYPAVWGELGDLMPNNGEWSASRRIFYPHPTDSLRLLIAEGAKNAPDEWVYKDVKFTPNAELNVRVRGVAGRRIGYTAAANYVGGAAYSPSGARTATAHKEPGGGSVLRVWDSETGDNRIIDWHSHYFARPYWIDENRLMVGIVEHYGSYTDYLIHQRIYDVRG